MSESESECACFFVHMCVRVRACVDSFIPHNPTNGSEELMFAQAPANDVRVTI